MEPVLGTTRTLTIFVPKNVSCAPETKSGQEQRQVQGRLRDCIQENGKGLLTAFIPISQQVEIVIKYHRYLGHTFSHNLHLFFHKQSLVKELCDINDILQHHEMCEKLASTLSLSPYLLKLWPHRNSKQNSVNRL